MRETERHRDRKTERQRDRAVSVWNQRCALGVACTISTVARCVTQVRVHRPGHSQRTPLIRDTDCSVCLSVPPSLSLSLCPPPPPSPSLSPLVLGQPNGLGGMPGVGGGLQGVGSSGMSAMGGLGAVGAGMGGVSMNMNMNMGNGMGGMVSGMGMPAGMWGGVAGGMAPAPGMGNDMGYFGACPPSSLCFLLPLSRPSLCSM